LESDAHRRPEKASSNVPLRLIDDVARPLSATMSPMKSSYIAMLRRPSSRNSDDPWPSMSGARMPADARVAPWPGAAAR
jgi:hypothetical protein